MNKYSVHFTDDYGRTSYIDVFHNSPEEASAYVLENGVGFCHGQTVKAITIHNVECKEPA